MTAREVLRLKKPVFELTGAWNDFIGRPERRGVWFIWGNSGNGKSSFAMQLCKELAKFERVIYNSLEEGDSLTMQNTLRNNGMGELGGRFMLIREDMPTLMARLRERKSPKVVVIDSFQYTQMKYGDYTRLRDAFPTKLFIFISHADGNKPVGRSAINVMYDASLKVWVEGYKAISKGRFIGRTGELIIWEEGANRYWNNNNQR